MNVETHPFFIDVLDWIKQAAQQGWIKADSGSYVRLLQPPPSAFQFEAHAQRPLIVAFMGGTGVGKSTLLNRLAGQALARTGVERPTSREISLYLHQSLTISRLPGDLPLSQVRMARHQDPRYRHVLWVDMPDFDSTEFHNRAQVMQWLPHIDVLLYVVSPERYRDDPGWQILRSQGREHAWLFIMNQWDRAHPLQLDDFAKLLAQGGFPAAIILRTDSSGGIDASTIDDDFALLEETLQSLADNHAGLQLEDHALSLRVNEACLLLTQLGDQMGQPSDLSKLEKAWGKLWRDKSDALAHSLDWVIRDSAVLLTGKLFTPALQSSATTAQAAQRPELLIWDDGAQMQLQDSLDMLSLEAENLGLPYQPLREKLSHIQRVASKQMLDAASRGLRNAQARPGNKLQRFFLKLTKFCEIFLPLAAALWISRDVIVGYYLGSLNQRAFLGADFAVHAALLIGIAWLLPFLLQRALTPSAERVAVLGLRKGIRDGLDQIEREVSQAIDVYQSDWKAQRAALESLASSSKIEMPEPQPDNRLLQRMLKINGDSAARGAAGKAANLEW